MYYYNYSLLCSQLTEEQPIIRNTQVLSTLCSQHVATDKRQIDATEEEKIRSFVEQGCGCRLAENGPCSRLFTLKYYQEIRNNVAELSWGELNMVLMGEVMALTRCDPTVTWHHSSKGREKNTTLLSPWQSSMQEDLSLPAWSW